MYRPKLHEVLKEVILGKAVSRTLSNLFWRDIPLLRGSILDIGGGGGKSSHYRFIPIDQGAQLKTVDVVSRPGTDFVLDINRERVPLPDASQDYIFLFNILEHLFAHDAVLSEVHRLLRVDGKLIGSIPFLVNVHPDPHDYVRFTEEALTDLFIRNGFSVKIIEPIGRGPFLAGYEQLDALIPSVLHALLLPFVWFADTLVSRMRPHRDFRAKFPLAYNFIAEKR